MAQSGSQPDRPEGERCGRVALAGRPNVGKSSLLNALVGEPLAIVSPKAQATRLPVTGLRTEGNRQFVFVDLPGLLDPAYLLQQRMRELAIRGLVEADVVLQLHESADAPAPDLRTVIGDSDLEIRAPALVVYTKADRVSQAERQDLEEQGGYPVSTEPQAFGLDRLLDAIAARLPERPFAYPADDLGTQPVRFFVGEYLREGAFEHLSDELPYAFNAAVEEFREGSNPVYIRATLFVERESQKRILIGAGGRTIKAIGSHARVRLEALLGSRVFLETWVKVLPRWRQSEEQLTRFGFPPPDQREGRAIP